MNQTDEMRAASERRQIKHVQGGNNTVRCGRCAACSSDEVHDIIIPVYTPERLWRTPCT